MTKLEEIKLLMTMDDGVEDLWLPPPSNLLELVEQLQLVLYTYQQYSKVEIHGDRDSDKDWFNVQVRISHAHKQIVLESI